MDEFIHLSFASSLCGNCSQVCPVNIPLHEMLLYNRNDSVLKGYSKKGEKFSMDMMKRFLSKRKRMDMFKSGMKNMGVRMVFKNAWGPRRELPKFAEKSFRDLWLERQGKN
jgi:L-lactate dehydrogenase complex protein LldF